MNINDAKPVVSYVNQAANFIQSNTGINPANVAHKSLNFANQALNKAWELKEKTSEIRSAVTTTLSKAHRIVETYTGINTTQVVQGIKQKYDYCKNSMNMTQTFVNTISDLNIPERFTNFTNVASEHLATLKDNLEKLRIEPSLGNGLKIVPWVAGGVTVGVVVYCTHQIAKEIGLYSKTKDMISGTWSIVKPGLKYGVATLALGITAIKIAENGLDPNGLPLLNPDEAMKALGMVELISLGVATTSMAIKAGSIAYDKIMEKISPEVPLSVEERRKEDTRRHMARLGALGYHYQPHQ